ncbi:MAG TPA: TSUP family transporter [Syntrophorhabdaceae bacterium]|jgi:hypothetical protein
MEIVCLCAFAALAGFIDSVAGGGGLIQLPALLIFLPHEAIAHLLGTNKLASIAGTFFAAGQYSRHVRISWKTTLPATLAALVFSFLGARVASHMNPALMRVVIIMLLVAILIHSFARKDFGARHAPRAHDVRHYLFSIATGMVLGFYDGFFGPGTGSFLIFVFIGVFGFSFLSASASSKVVNLATNLSAVLYFGFTDNILYALALPMAASNIAGSLVGARLAILKGNRFVRIFFLVVVSAMVVKLGYDTFAK